MSANADRRIRRCCYGPKVRVSRRGSYRLLRHHEAADLLIAAERVGARRRLEWKRFTNFATNRSPAPGYRAASVASGTVEDFCGTQSTKGIDFQSFADEREGSPDAQPRNEARREFEWRRKDASDRCANDTPRAVVPAACLLPGANIDFALMEKDEGVARAVTRKRRTRFREAPIVAEARTSCNWPCCLIDRASVPPARRRRFADIHCDERARLHGDRACHRQASRRPRV